MDTNIINLSKKNFHNICRICYKKDDLKNIFKSKYRKEAFSKILETCLPLKISENDGLPNHACLKCLTFILQIHAFLEQYKLSTKTLKSVHNYLYNNDRKCNKKSIKINYSDRSGQDTLLTDCRFVSLNDYLVNCDNTCLSTEIKEEQVDSFNEHTLEDIPLLTLASLPNKKRPDHDIHNLQLSCLNCNEFSNKTPAHLTCHQRSAHSSHEFICAICHRSYTMKYKLRRHLTVSHKHCTCDKCGLKLRRSSLTKHVKMHAPDYVPYKPPRNRRLCTVCGASVRYNFNAHMRNHKEQGLGMKPLKGMFQCELCPFETTHWTSLYRHKLRHKVKPFLCNTCGKDFSGKEFFDKHMRLHEDFDKPTPCYVCSESFNNEYDYGKHLSTHTYYVRKISNFDEYLKRKQKYKKRVSAKALLENGDQDESIVKPVVIKKIPNPNLRKIKTTYKCEPCNKIFKDNAHLQIHVTAIHENKREHKCLYCGKGFNLPNSLQEHIRTHTGETLKCDYCDKTFKQNSTRYKHLREAHNVHLGQIRKEKSKERREKDEIRKAYKKLKMKLDDVNVRD